MTLPMDAKMQENIRLRSLVRQTLQLFEEFGVVPGQGKDGILMKAMMDELSGTAEITTILNQNAACPLCKAPNFRECDCPVDEQMAAMGVTE